MSADTLKGQISGQNKMSKAHSVLGYIYVIYNFNYTHVFSME